MKKILIFVLLFVFGHSAAEAAKYPSKNNKFGVARVVFSDALFTIRSDNVEYSDVKPLNGSILFYEHVFGNYFSLGIHYGASMSRNLEDSAGESVVNVQETADFTAFDLKAFLSSNQRGGMKIYLGGGQGTLSIVSSISTRNSNGVSTKEEIEASVPVVYGSLGVDMFASRSSAGFRLEVSSVNAEKTETVNGTQAIYDYSGIAYLVAIFYRF